MSSRSLRTLLKLCFAVFAVLALANTTAIATAPGMPDPLREARAGLPLMPGLSQSAILPSAYQAFPFTQLDRDPTEGARHGFVQTTSGRFGFEVNDLTLPSRMPFRLGRAYDAGIIGMIPGVPTQEPRINYDFGPNWILKPSAGLIPTSPTSFLLLTDEGLVVPYQKEASGPKYWPAPDRPTAYGVMEPTGDGGFFARHSSGLKYTFRTIPSDVNYWLTKKEDASGNALNFTYNGGMLQRIDATDGYWVQLFRPVWGESAPAGTNPKRIVRITFGIGTTTAGQLTFQYSALGRLWKASGVDGGVWEFAYDNADHINQAIDPLGRTVFTITTAMPGHKATAVRFVDRDTAFNYLSNKTTVTEEDGGVFDYEFDLRGNTTKITDAEGGITQITRDAVRNDATQIIDPTGGVHAFQHDTQHRITQYSAPLLNGVHPSWTYSYSSAGQLIRSVAPGGAATTLGYDSAGRLTSESVDPGSDGTAESTTTYERATNGDVLAKIDADGRRTEYLYNAQGQVTVVKPPCLGTTPQVCPQFQWDWSLDKPTAFRWPLRAGSGGTIVYSTWNYSWSPGGRLSSLTTPIGGVTTFSYDLSGAMTQMSEPNGAVWTYSWRADGSLSRIDNPLGNAIQFDFDDSGRIYRKIDELGKYWRYYWDRMGRLEEAVDPENRSRKWRFDAAGRVIEDEAPGGQYIHTTYNALGFPIQRTLPGGGLETMTWDARGNVLTLEQSTPATPNAIVDRVTHVWDGRALPLSMRVEAGLQDAATKVDRTLTYNWTAAGRPTSYTDSDGTVWSAALDSWGRVTAATAGSMTNTIDYDPWNGWINHLMLADRGIEEFYSYDDAGNAHSVLEKKQGVTVTDQVFARDSGGQIAWITDGRSGGYGSGSVQRDLLGRPIQIEWGSGPLASYTWSARGELLTATRSSLADGNDLRVLEYDGAGLLTAERTSDYEANYTWNFTPSDPASALEVSRWGAGSNQTPATIRYGVDGQVREVWDEGDTPSRRRVFRWLAGGLGVPLAEDRYDAAGVLTSAARFVGAFGEVSALHSAQAPGAAAGWKQSSLLVLRSLESGNWRQVDDGMPFADRDEARISVTGSAALGALVTRLGGHGVGSGLGFLDGVGLTSGQGRDALASVATADYAAVVPDPDFIEPGVGLPDGASAAASVLHPQRWNDGRKDGVRLPKYTHKALTTLKPTELWKLSRCAFYETCDEASWPDPPAPPFDPTDGDDCNWDGRSQPPAPVRNADSDGIGISLPSGELTLNVTDLVLPGNGMDAVFSRSYHSQERFHVEHSLGYGWFIDLLDERVVYNGRFVDVWTPGGSRATYRVLDPEGVPLYFAASDRGKLRHDSSATWYEHRDLSGTIRRYEQNVGYHLTRVSRPGAAPITITWGYLARYGLYYPTRVSTWTCDDDPTTSPGSAAACTSDLKKELAYASFNLVLDANGNITSGDFAAEGQGIRLKRLPGIVVLGDAAQQQSHLRSICYSYNTSNIWAARLATVKIGQTNNCGTAVETVASYDYMSTGDLGNLTSIRDGAGAEVARIVYYFDAKVERQNDVVGTVTTPGSTTAGEPPALVTTYSYFVAGRRTVTTGARVSTRYYVGVAGNLCSEDPSHLGRVVRPDGTEIQYEYDDYGRLLKTHWPTGREEQWKYAQGDYYGAFLESPIQYRVLPSTTTNGEERQVTCYLPDPLTGGRWRSLGPILLPAPPAPGTPEPDPCVYTDANGVLAPRASETVANWMQAKLSNLEGITADTVSKDIQLNAYFARWHINMLGNGSQYPAPFPFRGETANENAVWPWLATAKFTGVASTKGLTDAGEIETLTTWQRPVTSYEYGIHGRIKSATSPVGATALYRYLLPGETGEGAERHVNAANLGLLAEIETRTTAGSPLGFQKFAYDNWANTKQQWSLLESVAPTERWIITESEFDMRGRVTRETRRSSQAAPDAPSTEARFGYDGASRLWKKIVETTNPAKTPTGKTWALITYEYNSAGLTSKESAWGELSLTSPTTDPGAPNTWNGTSTGPNSESRTTYDKYGQAIQSATRLKGSGAATAWAVTRRIFDSMGRVTEERGHASAWGGADPPTFNGDGTGAEWSTKRSVHRYWYDNPTGNLLYEQVQGMDSASDPTPLISGTTKYVYDGHERLLKTVMCDNPTAGTSTAPGCGSADGLRFSETSYDFADRPIRSKVCSMVAGQSVLQAWTETDYL